MKSLAVSTLFLDCSFLTREEYLLQIEKALRGDTLTHIVTLNAEMIVEAQRNGEFRAAVKRAELKIPDGSSLLWAKRYIEKKQNIFMSLIRHFFSTEQPLTGVDSIFDICSAVEKQSGFVYLIGGTSNEAQGTLRVLQKKYPKLNISILPNTTPSSLPLKRGGDALLVALGSPKQTLYIEKHRKSLAKAGIRIAIGVGGAFAMIAGTLPRAPRFMRRHHLEWLWRLILEPKRIKRIWNAVVIFPLIVRGYPH